MMPAIMSAPPKPLSPPAPAVSADDGELIRSASDGDRAAFAVLVRRHSGALLRFASALVKDRFRAEELVQETWLAALVGLRGFEGRSSLRTWLFQVLVNKARSASRRDGRFVPFSALPSASDDGAEVPRFDDQGGWTHSPPAWTHDTPERLVENAETRAVLEAAIAELPDGQRAVITLRDVEGLDTEEICNLLEISVTNQRVLLHRARARVRDALERYLGGADGC